VALSRRLELFFSGYLPQRLRDCFPTTYTVCAGSKELLLIGPWWQMVQLAADLNSRFRLYTGDNPNITLSAGLALMKANHFLPGAVREAEERLARAKFGDTYQAGYNRVCLIDEQPISWERLSSAIQGSEKLSSWLRTSRGLITTAVLYRLLYFADQRHRVEREMDMVCATWRARWGYYLAHQLRDRLPDRLKDEIINHFNRLLGLDKNMQKIAKAGEWQPAHLRIPVSIALYRNHS
jgi:CRISPR-associated protein Csm1